MEKRTAGMAASARRAGTHHTERQGNMRQMWGTPSNPASRLTLSFGPKFGDIQRNMLMGNRNVVCQTQADNKANKLNRNEQQKLEFYNRRLLKEHRLNSRFFRQKETTFRARSATVLKGSPFHSNIKLERRASLQSLTDADTDIRMMHERARSTLKADNQTECSLCAQIQSIIKTYKEEEGDQTAIPEDVPRESGQSNCMFTDSQVKTFIQILETKYSREMSDLRSNVKESRLFTPALHKQSRNTQRISLEEIDHMNANREISDKIKTFCIAMDEFNRVHNLVPETVKHEFETTRFANAIVKIEKPRVETPTPQKVMRRKVLRMLDLQL